MQHTLFILKVLKQEAREVRLQREKAFEANTSDKYKCTECPARFDTRYYLEKHQARHSTSHCKHCGLQFNTVKKLKDHIQDHHSTESHQCTNCYKVFKSARRLKEHKKVHLGIQHICNTCSCSFSTTSNLNKHIRHFQHQFKVAQQGGQPKNPTLLILLFITRTSVYYSDMSISCTIVFSMYYRCIF